MRWLLICIIALVGCTTVVKDTGRPLDDPRKVSDGPAVALPTDHPATIEEILGADPCETRLRDVQAELLMYQNAHGRLPPSLTDLKPYQSAPHEYVCPASKKPYEYYPNERMLIGSVHRIMVADPEPSHGGCRWCLFEQHNALGSGQVVDVRPISEAEFQKYVPVK